MGFSMNEIPNVVKVENMENSLSALRYHLLISVKFTEEFIFRIILHEDKGFLCKHTNKHTNTMLYTVHTITSGQYETPTYFYLPN